MGSSSDRATSVVGSKIHVGLSSIIGFTVQPGEIARQVAVFSGGTLEIGMTAGQLWGTGYHLPLAEIFKVDGPAMFYMAAAGATVVVKALQFYNT